MLVRLLTGKFSMIGLQGAYSSFTSSVYFCNDYFLVLRIN